MVEQLHNTIVKEQKEAIDFRQSVDLRNNGLSSSFSTGFHRQFNSKSHVDILDIYQTPRTTKFLLE